MPALQVKDCPAAVYEALRICAERENRSISQQTLTIIEQYLGMREGWPYRATPPAEPINYAERHKRALEKIRKLPCIPVTDDRPNAAELLRQIRLEEAR